jgi:hypothetical protein
MPAQSGAASLSITANHHTLHLEPRITGRKGGPPSGLRAREILIFPERIAPRIDPPARPGLRSVKTLQEAC